MTLSSFVFLFLFLTFFPTRKTWNHREAACTGYGDRQGWGCVVAFGLRDLRLVMKPLVVVFWTTI